MATTKIIPTPAAVQTAIKNAARDGGNYRLNDLCAHVGLWIVTHKQDPKRSYMVDTGDGSCECEQYTRQGICKHLRMVEEEIEVRAMEEGMGAAEFLLECSREHAVGFTAEIHADLAGAWA